MSQQICSDRHGMRTKKNLIQRQQIVKLYQNFLAFFSLLFLEEEEKNINSEAVQFSTNHLIPRQMMTNKEVFYPRFL